MAERHSADGWPRMGTSQVSGEEARPLKRRDILNRYSFTDDGKVILNIYIPRIEDLYNDFDRNAPYLKKDLDEEFVDYLIRCVKEIGKHDFCIRLDLEQVPDEPRKERIRKSIANYFLYLVEVERRNMRRMLRASIILTGIGVIVLLAAVWAKRIFPAGRSIIAEVFTEGLTVAGWVSLWEALATFLIQWAPHRRSIRLFRRVSRANVRFSLTDKR